MKAQHGEFIGPRAPFGYQKSDENPSQLVPDPVAAVIVRKIFEMAANGTGVTGIVWYLNERSLPTPIQLRQSSRLGRKLRRWQWQLEQQVCEVHPYQPHIHGDADTRKRKAGGGVYP